MTALVVSGHRDVTLSDIRIIRQTMIEYLEYREHDEILFGGARGADTVALETALEIRESFSVTWPKLIVVVPNTVREQPASSLPAIGKADQVIELKRPITRDDKFFSLHHRNHFMIDWAAPDGRLLAFWNGKPSGTGNVIRYANSQMVEVSTRTIIGETA